MWAARVQLDTLSALARSQSDVARMQACRRQTTARFRPETQDSAQVQQRHRRIAPPDFVEWRSDCLVAIQIKPSTIFSKGPAPAGDAHARARTRFRGLAQDLEQAGAARPGHTAQFTQTSQEIASPRFSQLL